jgi:sulfatase maturation enzyme AslB (radical SAM superfamily)
MTDKPSFDLNEETCERLLFFPKQLLLETTSHCNLNCSMCARQFKPRKWGTMEESLARRIIDEVVAKAPWCRIWFCYFGEPLVKRRSGLFDRIRYAKEKGLRRAAINTNANLMDEQCVRDMLDAGLDAVYIGIDATSSEIYDQVRRGGNFETVVANVHRLIKMAGERIKVTVQFGVYETNEHQTEAFRDYWANYPVNIFVRPKLTWIGYLSDHLKSEAPRHACAWIFDSINVNENGLSPYCICDWANRQSIGDTNQESIFAIWPKVLPYLIHHARGEWDKLPEFCQNCRDWQTKAPPKPEILAMLAQADIPTSAATGAEKNRLSVQQ